MVAQELIEEVGFGESTGGRRPILYRINPTFGYVLGLEISRTHARLICCDVLLDKKSQHTWPMSERMSPDVLIQEIIHEANRMLTNLGIPQDKLLGVGIGAVGPIDRTAGVIVDPLYFPAKGWQQVPICAMIATAFGVPVYLENGANTAIVGEYWADRVHNYQHLLYIHGGVGLRSAMMSGGQIVYGAVDMEGAIGQMVIQADGVPSRLSGGNYGALESYASLYAVEQKMQSMMRLGRKSSVSEKIDVIEQVTFPRIVEAAQLQDTLAIEVLTQSATYLGIGLANLLNTLHPEKVILGGPLIHSHALYYKTATQVAMSKTYYYPHYQVEFSLGQLGDEALAIGAAVMLVNKLTH
jgi:predicted NBD/HSP70 family sugar kinase